MQLSNDRDSCRPSPVTHRLGPVGALFVLLTAANAHAQDSAIDAWARWVTTQGRWAGPTVRFPEPADRPRSDGWVLDSEWLPLRLHAPRSTDEAQARAVLAALEHAWLAGGAPGWPPRPASPERPG